MAINTHSIPRLLILAGLCLALPLYTQAEEFTGKVVAVTDGDTIKVMHNGKAERVRLFGVDTPEKNQAYGTKAKQFTSDLVFGKEVRVIVQDTDRYGRTIGDVFLPNGKRLSNELVMAGMGWWYQQYAPKDTQLMRRHQNALLRKAGLWADPHPVAPWDFRKGRGSQPATSQHSESDLDFVNRSARPAPHSADTVFVTNTGTRYHRDGCQYLQKSKIPSSLNGAYGQGLKPCRVCKPDIPEYARPKVQPIQEQPSPRAPPQRIEPAPRQVQQQSVTVYSTNTGSKYHRDGCRYLSKSKIAISLESARSSLGACSVCNPPR